MAEQSSGSLPGGALRRPITVMVAVAAVVLMAGLSLLGMQRDILPALDIPTIFVAQPYGGMSPAEMESFLTYWYEYHFLYVDGIKTIESKSIQGVALLKLQFHTGTDMAAAMAETVENVNRAHAFMPPGTLPPFVMRYDAGGVPVGYLVFQSTSHPLGMLADMALNRVRPLFAALPGVSSPPPFGASQRSIVIRLDPDKMRRYHISPDDVAHMVARSEVITPAGNILAQGKYPIVPANTIMRTLEDFRNVPLRPGTYPTIFLGDLATIEDATDLPSGYAMVNGRPAVYIPITKRANASTLTVVDEIKSHLGKFREVLPTDVKVSFEFDQSVYVRETIRTVLNEGAFGAILTGLMVLLFLGDFRSAGIVVATIPFSLLGAVIGLRLTHQTINMMTLGGLSLAVGILVDQATVTIENVHSHLERGESLARAALAATEETAFPCLLNMLCILAVFIPAFVMKGVAQGLFVPLSLAVGFSMIASYLLSMTFVPVVSVWLLKEGQAAHGPLARLLHAFRERYVGVLERLLAFKKTVVGAYLFVTIGLSVFLTMFIGRDIFPQVDTNQFVVRLRAPTGTYFDETLKMADKALDIIKRESGGIRISIGYAGNQPPDFAINTIYLWSSGPEEANLTIELDHMQKGGIEAFKERLRKDFARELPDERVSFQPADIIDQVMSLGAAAPLELAASGPDYDKDKGFAKVIESELKKVPALRDVQIEPDTDYPAIRVDMNRRTAGIMGVMANNLGEALTSATSSSRYVLPIFWKDPKSGLAYQVQAEVPLRHMDSIAKIDRIGVDTDQGASIPLERMATVQSTTTVGEYDRSNMERMLAVGAEYYGEDLGRAAASVEKVYKALAAIRPRGVFLSLRGQAVPMRQLFDGLSIGLLLAVLVVFLLLAANFQSLAVASSVLVSVPAVLAGAGTLLILMGSTLNIQSFMGMIMAVGVAIANAIILVSFAERYRVEGKEAPRAAMEAAFSRLRPILMTAGAMVVGMIPMASGLEVSARQMAPLAQAVIGGLCLATVATLVILPLAYSILQSSPAGKTASLHPDDAKTGS